MIGLQYFRNNHKLLKNFIQ